MIKNSKNIIRTSVYIGGCSRLKPYKIRDYEDKTIDKISRNRYVFL